MITDHDAAASAVCAAKSAGWESLRNSNAGHVNRAVTHAQMCEADVAADEFRRAFHPRATRAFGLGDRAIGQPFEVYVIQSGEPLLVWSEA